MQVEAGVEAGSRTEEHFEAEVDGEAGDPSDAEQQDDAQEQVHEQAEGEQEEGYRTYQRQQRWLRQVGPAPTEKEQVRNEDRGDWGQDQQHE